jgi:hypothetical protein
MIRRWESSTEANVHFQELAYWKSLKPKSAKKYKNRTNLYLIKDKLRNCTNINLEEERELTTHNLTGKFTGTFKCATIMREKQVFFQYKINNAELKVIRPLNRISGYGETSTIAIPKNSYAEVNYSAKCLKHRDFSNNTFYFVYCDDEKMQIKLQKKPYIREKSVKTALGHRILL